MKQTEIEEVPETNPCYCCGVESAESQIVGWFGGAMRVWLCPFCQGAHFEWTDNYWALTCPYHGPTDIAGMVKYFNALDKFNELCNKKLNGKKVRPGVDWDAEIEKLREMYKSLM